MWHNQLKHRCLPGILGSLHSLHGCLCCCDSLLLALKLAVSQNKTQVYNHSSCPWVAKQTECSPGLVFLCGKVNLLLERKLTQWSELAEVRVLFIHVLSLLALRKESSDGFQPIPVRGQRGKNCENLVQGPGSSSEAGTDVKHSR